MISFALTIFLLYLCIFLFYFFMPMTFEVFMHDFQHWVEKKQKNKFIKFVSILCGKKSFNILGSKNYKCFDRCAFFFALVVHKWREWGLWSKLLVRSRRWTAFKNSSSTQREEEGPYFLWSIRSPRAASYYASNLIILDSETYINWKIKWNIHL